MRVVVFIGVYAVAAVVAVAGALVHLFRRDK
jgi:hypothetical protein